MKEICIDGKNYKLYSWYEDVEKVEPHMVCCDTNTIPLGSQRMLMKKYLLSKNIDIEPWQEKTTHWCILKALKEENDDIHYNSNHITKWIIPCNINDYDVDGAFSELSEIDWKQSMTNINIGDIVFIYVSAPVQKIKYMCRVLKVNKPNVTIDDSKFYIHPDNYVSYPKHMQLRLIKKMDTELLSFDELSKHGLNGRIQGPRTTTLEIDRYIENSLGTIENKKRVICCEIAWMESYDGPEDNVNSGGEYVRANGFGHEEINYRKDNGYYRGFVQSSNNKININRIDSTESGDYLDDVLVVWCAKNPKAGRTVVGYYNHARAYKNIQKRLNSKYDGYYFEAKCEDCKLLPVNKRNFMFDSIKKGNFGEANVWYADAEESKIQLERLIDYVDDIINNPIDDVITEIEKNEEYYEGRQRTIFVTSRERNPEARKKCIEKYGYTCQVCNTKLEDVYGPIAKEYIHVHHISFISDSDGEHVVDPEKDLIPVCPNCHAMLHTQNNLGKYLSIEELKNEMALARIKQIKVGTIIVHPIFGKGEVRTVTEKQLEVYFSSQGIKKLQAKYIYENCDVL